MTRYTARYIFEWFSEFRFDGQLWHTQPLLLSGQTGQGGQRDQGTLGGRQGPRVGWRQGPLGRGQRSVGRWQGP